MATMTFQVDDRSASTSTSNPPVWVTVVEQGDGSLVLTLSQTGSVVGDLRAVFFDVADESVLTSLHVLAQSPDIRIGNDSIVDLGGGANVNGLTGSDGGYDVGIEVGGAGLGADDVRTYSFTLSSTAQALTLQDLSQVDFAVRLTSVGTEGGDRVTSAKLLETTSPVLDLHDVSTVVWEDQRVDGSLFDGLPLAAGTVLTGFSGGAAGQVQTLISGADPVAYLTVQGDGRYTLDANVGDPLSEGESIDYHFTFDGRYQDEATAWSTDTATWTVTVKGVNDGPVAEDDNGGSVPESEVLAGDVTLNDSDVDRLDTHVWTLVEGSFTGLGALALNADGTWMFDAQGNYDALTDGQRQTLRFQYQMTDNHGASDTAWVTFDVVGEGPVVCGCGDDDPPSNDFPRWAQDISNITLVFQQTAGDIKPTGGGDGYYTVKIDVDAAFDDDLDTSLPPLLQALLAVDANLSAQSDLLGVVIKGGLQITSYYAYGVHNINGTAADTLPADLGFDLPGDHGNVDPVTAIDRSYSLATLMGV